MRSLEGNPEVVGIRVRRLLAGLAPSAVVGAAADGADLLVLEAALALPDGPAVHVVLPTTRQIFREDSVESGSRHRFDNVVAEVLKRGGTVETLDLEPGEGAYRRANQVILDRAAELAEGDQRCVGLVVAAPGEGRMIDDLLHRSALTGTPVLRIDPTVDIPSRPKCFILMPFGVRTDAERRFEVDCDLVYSKILVPTLENAQLDYERADAQIDSGIVLEPMIESLARADLVIADLQTGNFNVGWELGLRHLLRPGQTILIGPAGTRAPFDVSALRHVRYRDDAAGISDDAAVEAWSALGGFVARAGKRPANDSPSSR
ncbi:hypothetical protein [Nakamurella sp.]|uniref:hypothetical protein n=1 Tax=Nakamurella sp. TaxID=1869182 RepID=UPI00378308D0